MMTVKMTRRALWVSMAISACSSLAIASDWAHYGNARFQYWIDIPPNFSGIEESENGDGGTSSPADGSAKLSVWGGYLIDDNFSAEARRRIDQDRDDGWSVTYQKQQAKWAVWSGSRGARIFYERAIPTCNDAVAYFRLEYERTRAKAFDPIISRLTRSFRKGDC